MSLPHTQTVKDGYSWCAYTEKVRKFCNMMRPLGYHITLYAGDHNEADVDELVTCVRKDQQAGMELVWSAEHPTFANFNLIAIHEMRKRILPGDVICIIGGNPNEPISKAFPDNKSVEFGIGYVGVYAPYRVFESYAWMHTVYGNIYGAYNSNGSPNDEVIPNYFEVDDFPKWSQTDDPYFLYIGRMIDRKGIHLAADACERLGAKLILAGGEGTPPEYGEYRGVVGPKERGELMSRATAVLVPTQYVEPFGGVHVEAQLCGTPVITSDWGVFTETVQNGFNGYRCKDVDDMVEAMRVVGDLDRDTIREYARGKWSTEAIAKQYDKYLKRVAKND